MSGKDEVDPTSNPTRQPEPFFTGVVSVDLEILQMMDDPALTQFLGVSRYAKELGESDFFWKKRILLRYPGAEDYKESHITWKKFYIDLSQSMQIGESLCRSLFRKNIGVVKYLINYENIVPDKNHLEITIYHSLFDEFVILVEHMDVKVDEGGDDTAEDFTLGFHILQQICWYGDVEFMDYLYRSGRIKLVRQMCFDGGSYFDTLGDSATSRPKNLKWLIDHDFYDPNEMTLEFSAQHACIESLKMLDEEYGCPPDEECALMACTRGYFDITRWMVEEKGLNPTQEWIDLVEEFRKEYGHPPRHQGWISIPEVPEFSDYDGLLEYLRERV
jgi:hypothetical protein